MFSFKKTGTLKDFQKFIDNVYSLNDDRLYSIWDILTQQQRFTMRALKGIRKGSKEKLKINLLISLSWVMAMANRLHIDIEDETWRRFPGVCSYCGNKPCVCKKIKPSSRLKPKINDNSKPKNLQEFQLMFNEIYPPEGRNLEHAGIHLAEEMGEVSEVFHNYMGQHQQKQFNEVKQEIADFISCVFGVANSAGINVSEELSGMYQKNCHVCHRAPCVCKFSDVAQIET
ncbi:MAG: hypothetical protein AAB536_02415 [Patescibacteria group bacterium]